MKFAGRGFQTLETEQDRERERDWNKHDCKY